MVAEALLLMMLNKCELPSQQNDSNEQSNMSLHQKRSFIDYIRAFRQLYSLFHPDHRSRGYY